MSNAQPAPVKKWPFLLMDLVLCALAGFVVWKKLPAEGTGDLLLVAAALAVGGWAAYVGVLPWILDHRTQLKELELDELSDAAARLNQLDGIAQQIQEATGNWRMAQEQSSKLLKDSSEAAQHILSQAGEVGKSLNQASEQEKQALRLEVEKLRKNEVEWLQVAVRMLDHTYALFSAAVQSGQPKVIAQLEKFQGACREAARRVGLVAFEARAQEPFNPKAHQLVNPSQADEPEQVQGAIIEACIAPGFTFQGQLVRKPLVSILTKDQQMERDAAGPEPDVNEAKEPHAKKQPEPKPVDPQESLPL